MRIAYFTHSLASCWNHGNAHFLRGVLSELVRLGHDVAAFEPEGGWSATNLAADHGPAALEAWRCAYPELASATYRDGEDVAALIDGADVVIVHEWNEPWLVAAVGRARRSGRFTLLFHDTHHRAVSDPAAIARFELDAYDGVLAFGESLAEVYRARGWGARAFVWREAADVRLFRPPDIEGPREGVVWIGNWGDDERSAELEEFLLAPASVAALPLDIWGVRYPPEALALLQGFGARYHGWIPNIRVPQLFAKALMTVHVPRRFYAGALAGIPTIRVYEALACGIPLICAPWEDREGQFRPGRDYLVAPSGEAMATAMRLLAHDGDLRAELARSGVGAVLARHTCRHRALELIQIVSAISAKPLTEAAA